jgi:subfamily B ATP-binding cassette protein HlyB/CyaB
MQVQLSPTTTEIQTFLAKLPIFAELPDRLLTELAAKLQFLRYRLGQAIFVQESLPAQIAILYAGQARLLGRDPRTQETITLQRLEAGDMMGWAGLLRGIPCETITASTDALCLVLPAADFIRLLEQEAVFASIFQNRAALIEVFDLLGAELMRRADSNTDLRALALQSLADVRILNLPAKKAPLHLLSSDRTWLVSQDTLVNFPVGSRLLPYTSQADLANSGTVRLVGIPGDLLSQPKSATAITTSPLPEAAPWTATIPYAPELPPHLNPATPFKTEIYPYTAGKGNLDAPLACFQMLGQFFGVPFRRDMVRKVLINQRDRLATLANKPEPHSEQTPKQFSLQFCGAVTELMGLSSQLVKVPATAVCRLQTPALTRWQDSFAVLYKLTEHEVVLAVPEVGIVRQKPAAFLKTWGSEGEVLLLKATKNTPQKRFGLRWFLPSIKRYRKVLLEVLLASMFVQIFGLVNPLATQVIFDKVLVQNSVDTLSVMGIFLVGVAAVEAVLSSLRTYLFVDTTNRIDLSLGTEVINHLLRLPLSYFERRPVGELAIRVNEMENIRQFLTGTALTVVLDAVFSVVYLLVMVFYSPVLTLVALATVPLFALLTLFVSPLIRQQARTKAERNAATHSYLVEVLAGVQTMKAQNLELRSRWQWQERYARYVSAGFKSVITSTTAGAVSSFLEKLSSLLVLWVGAYLVLQGTLTLGQLVAFRILANYVTNPLLRLIQLWQSFQETALSLERLGDIIDANQEADAPDSHHILMPSIQGAVKYSNVAFSFGQGGNLQLCNINLDIPAGTFVGIVGQSGSGKSTLTKLLPRLYELKSGQISIDNYDISKVELYSLRRQIGMVLQDTLLFDGTIRENIALSNPDADDEQIIAAAQTAFAHDFIMALPNGYNTRVGERGSALSGGQRQRIAIARTILQNPQLLILDEATSALDYNAERQVCLNLAETMRGRTFFFITHRLNTIRNADVILMMDQGAIVERGTHSELMALKGRYYCLYQQQEAQIQG